MLKTKSLRAQTKKGKDGTLIAVASTEDTDRMGDILRAGGWKLKNFKKNPVLQFAHNYSIPPVGIAKNIKVQGNKLIFEPVFHEITQLAREVKEMYEASPPIMSAFSVGFIPKKSKPIERKGEIVGQEILELELLEISAVPVPANASALTIPKSYEPEVKEKVSEWVKDIEGDTEEGIKEETEEDTEEKPETEPEIKEEVKEEVDEKIEEEDKEGNKETEEVEETEEDEEKKEEEDEEKKEEEDEEKKEEDDEEDEEKKDDEEESIEDIAEVKEEEEIKKVKKEIYNCECIECGHTLKSDKHCKDIKCPKCDGEMRRVERPGPGKEQDNIKNLEKSIELLQKEGRVLSDINRKRIVNTIDQLVKSISVLEDLLQISEPTNGEGKSSIKGRKRVVQKRLASRVTVLALQNIAGEVNETLYRIKNNK